MEQPVLRLLYKGLFMSVHSQSHTDLFRQPQQLLQQFHLYGGKSIVAIQGDDAASHRLRLLYHLLQRVQKLLHRQVHPLQIFPEALIDYQHILQFKIQLRILLILLHDAPEFLRLHPVLRKLREQGFDLGYVAQLLQVSAQEHQLVFLLLGDAAQNQVLARILQDPAVLASHFAKDPVRQTFKAQHVDIHDPVPGMHPHQILLGLHSKLFRHNDQELLLRILHGPPDHLFK